ncbi:MAG: 50S ribosomal protein L24 [Sphingobium sp.]|nr:50S ribosomal protein L24 [Sphingobium sp.]
MSAAKIKKGDKVVVLAGKDKGTHRRRSPQVTAQGRQGRRRRHQPDPRAPRASPSQANPQGGLSTAKPAPLHMSNVAIADPKTASRPACASKNRDGKKVRVAVKTGEVINGR